MTTLLSVKDLVTEFRGEHGVARAVDGVSFDVGRGEVLGIVGESGSGKSATLSSVLRILPRAGYVAGGTARLGDVDLLTLPAAAMQKIRGKRIAMIFQDPMTSLNPYLRVGEQLAEVGTIHLGLTEKEAWARGVALLDRVGIPDPAARARSHAHELSGGMRQRVMIAMALLGDPDVLFADEPTTALDVTIQAQILSLLAELRRERGLAIVLVTHDLGVVMGFADRVAVMYAGRIVESAPSGELFRSPQHPYTRALLRSLPGLSTRGGRLQTILGMPPRLGAGSLAECAFAPRCPLARAACREGAPPLTESAPGHTRRCILPVEELR